MRAVSRTPLMTGTAEKIIKRAIVVLGMHRSGTSSVAGALVHLGGTAPATLLTSDVDNPRGFWESLPVIRVNDRLLGAAGSYWADWRRFDSAVIAPEAADELRHDMAEVLSAEFGQAPFIVVKDPRMCRLWPLWEPVLAAEGYQIEMVLPIRSPLEVAGSLQRRNGMSTADGLLLWLRHVLDAEIATRGRPRRILFWDCFLLDWRGEIERIEAALGWQLPSRDAAASARVDDFLSDTLRTVHTPNDALSSGPDVHRWVSEVYDCFLALEKDQADPTAWEALDSVRAVFDDASRLFGGALGPLLGEAEAARHAQLRALDSENRARQVVQRLRRNLLIAAEQRERLASDAEAQANQLAASLSHAHAELQAARDEVADAGAFADSLRRDRDDLIDRLAITETRAANELTTAQAVTARAEDATRELEFRLSDKETAYTALQARLTQEESAYAELRAAVAKTPVAVVWSVWTSRLSRAWAR